MGNVLRKHLAVINPFEGLWSVGTASASPRPCTKELPGIYVKSAVHDGQYDTGTEYVTESTCCGIHGGKKFGG